MNIFKGNIVSILLHLFLLESGVLGRGGAQHGTTATNGGRLSEGGVLQKEPQPLQLSNFDKLKDSKHKQMEQSNGGLSKFSIDQKMLTQTEEIDEKRRAILADATGGGKEGSIGSNRIHLREDIFNDISASESKKHGQVPNNKKRLGSTFSFRNSHSNFVKNTKKEDSENSQSMQAVGSRNLKSESIMEDNIFTHMSLSRESLNDEQSRVEDVTHANTRNHSVQNNDDKASEVKKNQVISRKVSGKNRFSSFQSGAMQMPLTAVRFISNYNYDGTDTLYCLKPRNLRPHSELRIRACDSITDQSNWFYFDSNDNLRLSIDSSKCIRWVNTRLYLENCPLGKSGLKRAQFKFNTILRGIEAQKGGSLKQWMTCIDPTDKFDLVRLYLRNAGKDNKSCYAWTMDYASESPSLSPTSSPSLSPSSKPSLSPSSSPSSKPSKEPSLFPSSTPSVTPTAEPSMRPSASPTTTPSSFPSSEPSLVPSSEPSLLPSSMPSDIPSDVPSDAPSDVPSDQPSLLPSSIPSDIPSGVPSDEPSQEPSTVPSDSPSSIPSSIPSNEPSVCQDDHGWEVNAPSSFAGLKCDHFYSDEDDWCGVIGQYADHAYNGKTIYDACCACGGAAWHTVSPTSGPSSLPSTSAVPTASSVEPSVYPSSSPSDCKNEPDWFFDDFHDPQGVHETLTCSAIERAGDATSDCDRFKHLYHNGKNTESACCVCGGGVHISVHPSSVPSNGPSRNPSSAPTESQQPSKTASESPSFEPSVSALPSLSPIRENSVNQGESCTRTEECKANLECRETQCAGDSSCEICLPNGTRRDRFLDLDQENYYKPKLKQRSRNEQAAMCIEFEYPIQDYQLQGETFNANGYMDIEVSGEHTINQVHGAKWGVFNIEPVHLQEKTIVTIESIRWHTEQLESNVICFDIDIFGEDSRRCYLFTGLQYNHFEIFDAAKPRIDLQNACRYNLALGKTSRSSSVHQRHVSDASKAVDGYIDPRYHELVNVARNSISLTNYELCPWWSVDLESVQTVHRIFIHFSTDFDLSDFKFFSSQSTSTYFSGTACFSDETDHDSYAVPISFASDAVHECDGCTVSIQSNIVKIEWHEPHDIRYIRIEAKGASSDVRVALALAEVLVFGNEVESDEDSGTETISNVSLPVGNLLSQETNFGYPIWNGVKSRIFEGSTEGGPPGVWHNDNMVIRHSFTQRHIFTDTILRVTHSMSVRITISRNSNEEGGTIGQQVDIIYQERVNMAADQLSHVTFPENTIGDEISIDLLDFDIRPSDAQWFSEVFGSTSPAIQDGAYDDVPYISHVAFLRNELPEDVTAEEDYISIIGSETGNEDVGDLTGEVDVGETAEEVVEIEEEVNQIDNRFTSFQCIKFEEGEVEENSDAYDQFRPLTVSISTETGSYPLPKQTLSASPYGNEDAFQQDFGGELYNRESLETELHGNVWKAFKLHEADIVPITDGTTLSFQFRVSEEAEGHAICLENDLIEDPFRGKHSRCMLLAGSQFSHWNHVHKKNIIDTNYDAVQSPTPNEVTHPTIFQLGLASHAFDEHMNTSSNTGPPNQGADAVLYTQIQQDFVVQEILIHNRMDKAVDRLRHLRVYVSNNSDQVIYSKTYNEVGEDGIVSIEECVAMKTTNIEDYQNSLHDFESLGEEQESLVEEAERVPCSAISGDLEQTTIFRREQQLGKSLRLNGVIHIKDIVIDETLFEEHLFVGIVIINSPGLSYPNMVKEFAAFGRPKFDTLMEYSVKVRDLYPEIWQEEREESRQHIRYVILIQDNDENQNDGSSVFSNFVINEVSITGNSFDCGDICHSGRRGRELLRSRALQEDGTNCSREGGISPMCEIFVTPLYATEHENFGSFIAPIQSAGSDDSTWSTSKEKMPNNGERTNGYEIVEDVNVDPKDDCYYASIETYGYETLNPDGTIYNHFLKKSFGRVINSEGVQIQSALPTTSDYSDSESDDLFCKSGRVGNLDEDLYSEKALIDAANKFYRDHINFYETYDLLPYYGTATQSSTARYRSRYKTAEEAMFSILDNYFSATMVMLDHDVEPTDYEYGEYAPNYYKSGEYPWWEVKFHQPVVGTKLEIQFNTGYHSNGGPNLYPTSIKILISKNGNNVREISEDTTTWVEKRKELDLRLEYDDSPLPEFDKIRIIAEAMDGAPFVLLQLGRVFVKGGISFTPYLEEFKAKKPQPLLDGQVSCSDEIERVRFQTFICGLSQDSEFYHDERLASATEGQEESSTWWFPDFLKSPEEYKADLISYFQRNYQDDYNLQWTLFLLGFRATPVCENNDAGLEVDSNGSRQCYSTVFTQATNDFEYPRHGIKKHCCLMGGGIRTAPLPSPAQELVWEGLADVLVSNYRTRYNELIQSFQLPSMQSYLAHSEPNMACSPEIGFLPLSTYYCFNKDVDHEMKLTYFNTVEDDDNYEFKLQKKVRKQNNYGFNVMGEVASSQFPKYISHLEQSTIAFQKGCHRIVIRLIEFDPLEPLPTIPNIGELPPDCRKTGKCVINWCHDTPTFTLSASSERNAVVQVSQISPSASSGEAALQYESSSPASMQGQSLAIEQRFCLNQDSSSTFFYDDQYINCAISHSWTSAIMNSESSAIRKRVGLKIARKRLGREESQETYFQFPYEWNFEDYRAKIVSGSTNAVDVYHSNNFVPPANIIVRSTLHHVAFAHSNGDALAIYCRYPANGDISFSVVVWRADGSSKDINVDDMEENLHCYIDGSSGTSTTTNVIAADLSDSGQVAALGTDSAIYIYRYNPVSSEWEKLWETELANIIHIGLSEFGHILGVITNEGTKEVLVYEKSLEGADYLRFGGIPDEFSPSSHDQISINVSKSGVISIQLRDSTDSSVENMTREVHRICHDTNAVYAEGGCQCKTGMVLKNSADLKVLRKFFRDQGDVCVHEIHAAMITVTSNAATFPIPSFVYCHDEFQVVGQDVSFPCGEEDEGDEGDEISPNDLVIEEGIRLEKKTSSGSVISIENRSAEIQFSDDQVKIVLKNLIPGQWYNLHMVYRPDTFLEVPFVTPCNCVEDTDDLTGAPKDFSIIGQDEGIIKFRFKDNSKCENIFSLVRYSSYEEFSQHIGTMSSVASMKTGSGPSCEDDFIEPFGDFIDDLQISRLTVGHTYVYCIMAENDQGAYMPNPYDTTKDAIDFSSSEKTCAPFTILWESSVDGIITTEPHVGSLPVANVRVEYQLLSSDHETLHCEECRGIVTTKDDGTFSIAFRASHPFLHGHTHRDEIGVKFNYSKSTNGLNHEFLCSSGAIDCALESVGLHLKHLEFGKRLHVFDATHILFTGKVFVNNTPNGGDPGCPVVGASVCAMREINDAGDKNEITCTETDGSGNYQLALVVGTLVKGVEITYYEHNFQSAAYNHHDYERGILIRDGIIYNGNDFRDMTMTDLKIEVAGGNCNIPLGLSTIKYNILGCSQWEETLLQNGVENTYQVPAALLQVRIDNLEHENDHILQVLGAIQKNIDLRSIVYEESSVNEETSGESINESVITGDMENYTEEEDQHAIQALDTVRFQYEGELSITLSFSQVDGSVSRPLQEKPCYLDNHRDQILADSLHLVDYMSVLRFDIDLTQVINGESCTDIGGGFQLEIQNDIGMDSNSGFYEFFWGLSEDERKTISYCSSIPIPIPLRAVYGNTVEEETRFQSDMEFFRRHNSIANNSNCVVPFQKFQPPNGDPVVSRVFANMFVGRPTFVRPYVRKLTFTVLHDDIVDDVRHTAAFFVEGKYDKGVGRSFPVPTHKPVMVLRDPPGGDSYAKYENIQSTFKLFTEDSSANVDLHFKAGFDFGAGVQLKGGFGPVGGFAPIPLPSISFEQAKKTVHHEVDFEHNQHHTTFKRHRELSNHYTTTWSYTTSDVPETAGKDSDIIVVPNVNIQYREVLIIEWDHETIFQQNCGECCDGMPKLVEVRNEQNIPIMDFPSSVTLEIDTTDGNAFAFYTRSHLIYYKMPELRVLIENQEIILNQVLNNEVLCCTVGDGRCGIENENTRTCIRRDIDFEQNQLQAMNSSLTSWESILREMDESSTIEFSNFFTNENDSIRNDSVDSREAVLQHLVIRSQPRTLVKPQFIEDAEINPHSSTFLQDNGVSDTSWLAGINRIQIEGNAGMLEFSLSKKAVKQMMVQGCQSQNDGLGTLELASEDEKTLMDGNTDISESDFDNINIEDEWKNAETPAEGNRDIRCDEHYDFSIGGKTPINVGGGIFGPFSDVKLTPELRLQIVHDYTSEATTESDSETMISFALGDPDGGDEIIMDIEYDQRYKSFVFKLVGGVTKCVYEGPPTLKSEDPLLRSVIQPSAFVFPDEDIIFDIEIANVGAGIYSFFLLAQDMGVNGSSLEVRLDDGWLIDSWGRHLMLERDIIKRRQVRVRRPVGRYQAPPVQILLKSKCEAELDTVKEGNQITLPLSNARDANGNEVLQWIEPCPSVEWAGRLLRDRSFLVNKESQDENNLLVMIRNPAFGSAQFTQLIVETRLEHVNLKYRKIGQMEWLPALDSNSLAIDFANEDMEENSSGFISAFWHIGGNFNDGNYEIIVEAECQEIDGSDEFSFFQTKPIIGSIDRTRPKQYGKAIPLKNYVMLGEEMSLFFDKPLDCSFPYSFELEIQVVEIEGPTATPSVSNAPTTSSAPTQSIRIDPTPTSPTILTKDNLLIICEDRSIKFQVDYTQVDPDILINKEFIVEVGSIRLSTSSIKDSNGNSMNPNSPKISFRKMFAPMNLEHATSRLLVSNHYGSVQCSKSDYSFLRQKIHRELVNISDSKCPQMINVTDIYCSEKDKNTVKATVDIQPIYAGRRYLKNKEGVSPNIILQRIRNATKTYRVAPSRSLKTSDDAALKIEHVEVIPCETDLKEFSSSEEELLEEKRLYENTKKHLEFGSNELLLNEIKNEEDTLMETFGDKLTAMDTLEEQRNSDMKQALEQLRKEKKLEMEALEKKRILEMEQLKREKQQDMEEFARLLREATKPSDTEKLLLMQNIAILVGCSVLATAAFITLRRS